ncbi:hypothetical protein ACFYT3_22455 [Nocardia amikacinitolerans]|uniref:hypothetical protein n=1 Tax=Nocardia amikacinitolerans TaxID=756689 RepID=UPI0036B36FA5
MALVGLVRVSTSKLETQRQHDDLDPICVRVFEEKLSGSLTVAQRPSMRAALDYIRFREPAVPQIRCAGPDLGQKRSFSTLGFRPNRVLIFS